MTKVIGEEYRGYKISPDGGFSLVSIKSLGQGPVPKELVGVYTTRSEAMKAIDRLLTSKERVNQNGKPDIKAKGRSTD